MLPIFAATRLRLGIALFLTLFPAAARAQPGPMWVPTDLGTLGGNYSFARDINAAGQVVGDSVTAAHYQHAFIWTATGGMVDPGTLAGYTSTAWAINNAGQVVGISEAADLAMHGFLWTAAGGLVDLGRLIPHDINNAGEIAGELDHHAFLRTASGTMVDLGTLGGTWSQALCINNAGQVVGLGETSDGFSHMFLWTAAGGMVDLGSLGPVPSLGGINDTGQVVGRFQVANGQLHAFSWTAAGMIDLGTLGGTSSVAFGVNDAGQVVGYSDTANGRGHAFSWTREGGMVDVGGFGGPGWASTAMAINEAGQIVGRAEKTNGDLHAVLWNLVYTEPPAVTSLTANVAFPAVAGTTATWTATAAGGAPPYTFQYWIFDGTVWRIARDWSPSASWTWEAVLPGKYTVQVWVRNAGSSANYDAWLGVHPTVLAPSSLTITAVTPDRPSGSVTAVNWTVTALGGSGLYTYAFFVFDGTTWKVGRDWSAQNTWYWFPPTPGTYVFQVWARNAGSTNTYDAWRSFGPYTAVRPPGIFVTSVTPDLAPVPAGTPVTCTATAAGGRGPYAYQFLVRSDGGPWTIAQAWSKSNTWTWVPVTAGSYTVAAIARDTRLIEGGGNDCQVTVVDRAALRVSLISDWTLPVPAGTPITWTARGVGGTGPYTYKFLLFDGVAWHVVQNWSPSQKWTWLPTGLGTWGVQVWIRSAGSTNAYDAWDGSSALEISAATSQTAITLTSAPMSPFFVGEPVVLSATAFGGTGPYTYQFWVYDGAAWSIGQAWSPSNTYTWWPLAVGAYWIQVWVRNAGSTSPYDVWTALGPLTLLTSPGPCCSLQ